MTTSPFPRILHINQSDVAGGAAIAGFRLHSGLLAVGADSNLLVGRKTLLDPRIAQVDRFPRIEQRLGRLSNRFGLNYTHLISSFKIPMGMHYKNADVLNFHNLHTGYFNYLAIPRLVESKPAVYTIHDMWAVTGHCAYSYDCDRWKTGCGSCPDLETYPSISRDSTKSEWKLKQWALSKRNIKLVTPSSWMTQIAKNSFLSNLEIHEIPYGLDLDVYKPLNKNRCKYALGIPEGKIALMFGARSILEPRKGGDLLIKALSALPALLKGSLILLTIGSGRSSFQSSTDIETIDLGLLSSDRLKAVAFSAADVFLFPTKADNLPLVLQESMACGTPMVSFDIGGVPDLVRPGVTGLLARSGDAIHFRQRIIEIVEDTAMRERLGLNCRTIAESEYSLELQAKRYLDLYSSALN